MLDIYVKKKLESKLLLSRQHHQKRRRGFSGGHNDHRYFRENYRFVHFKGGLDKTETLQHSSAKIWRFRGKSPSPVGEKITLQILHIVKQPSNHAGCFMSVRDYVYNPKDNAGVRPICVFSVVDRIVYQALLNPLILGNTIDGKLFNVCFCNRILGEDKYLKPYKGQWVDFCDAQIKAFKKGLVWRFEFDIHTYYENIHIDTLVETLKEKFQIRDERLLTILESQLKHWSEKRTMCGLPQGANASNVLANAYLHPFDTFLDDLRGKDHFEYFRYNDDTVITAESADKINSIIEKAVLFLRTYNLNLNEKSKLVKLGNTKSIEEVKFHNPYAHLNETSRQKLEEISKKIPTILRNLKSGKEIKKTDVSSLRYYLKAGAGMGDQEIFDALIALIPNKPSLIFEIGKYFGFYFSNEDKEFYLANKELIHAKYESIWKMYRNKSLTAWTKFWLLKVLSTPPFAREHKGFQAELDRIVADSNAQILRPLAFFYKAYMRDMVRWERAMKKESIDSIDAGFTLDDIKRQIRNSKMGAEQAIYYYFIFYLRDTENEGVIRGLVYDALQSESPEVQVRSCCRKRPSHRTSLMGTPRRSAKNSSASRSVLYYIKTSMSAVRY
jgi:hypothetical protein